MPFHFLIADGCFHDTRAELSSFKRGHLGSKIQDIYYLVLHRKILPNPGLGNFVLGAVSVHKNSFLLHSVKYESHPSPFA